MATWSIIGDGARIDSNTGKITFDENTTSSDRNFTVTYEDNYGNTASTVITQMRRNGVDSAGVDLGLPSGNIWCNSNAFGDGTQYYQYGKGNKTIQVTSGETNYDGNENPLAASADTLNCGWNGPWHIPTKEDFQDLIDNTNHSWSESPKGMTFSGRGEHSGDTIFLPANGGINGSNGLPFYTHRCLYWTSTPHDINSSNADCFVAENDACWIEGKEGLARGHGLNIRGVYKDYSRQKYD
jgi:hypothetical protein